MISRAIVLVALSCFLPSGDAPDEKSVAAGAPQPVVAVATLNRHIASATRDYLITAVDAANTMGAEALVIVVDTPGGTLEGTRDVVQAILGSSVPIVVYVAPPGARAASAGVFIAQAAHVAAMAPTTHMGAAHPVSIFGGDVEGEMARKVENDTAAWARSLAQTRGRNADWVEKAVRESASLPAADALSESVIDLIADDLSSLLLHLDGRTVKIGKREHQLRTRGARIQKVKMTERQAFVDFLADPNLMYLLMLLGVFLVFIEVNNPGLIVPGVVGVLLLVLVLGVQVLPVNWIGVILVLGSAAFFLMEVYVTSFGLLAAVGLACLVAGSYLLFDVPGSPFRVNPRVIWSVALTFAALLLGVGYLLIRAKRQGPTSGVDGMKGDVAQVFEAIVPGVPGRIAFRGAYWTATSDQALKTGQRVRVLKMEGTRAVVAPLDASDDE